MDIRALDLNLLLVFEAILRERSVTGAAAAVGLTQPAVSSALARLRVAVGDPLFVRTRRGMIPTTRAEELAGPLLRALTDIRQSLQPRQPFSPAESDRTFSLLLSDIGEVIFLPRLVEHLRRTAPGIHLSIHYPPARERVDAFENGELDLAIGYFPQLRGPCHRQRLYADNFGCLLRANHPTIGDRLTIEQFMTAPHIVVSPQGLNAIVLEKVLAERQIALDPVLRVPRFVAVPPTLIRTDMIAIVPARLGAVYAATGRFRLLELPFETPFIRIHQYWHRISDHDPAVAWLRSVVDHLFREGEAENAPRARVSPG